MTSMTDGHQEFCAIGFSGACSCRDLIGRLTHYADKMTALHNAGKAADPTYRGIEVQAKVALMHEAVGELTRFRRALLTISECTYSLNEAEAMSRHFQEIAASALASERENIS